MKRPCSTQNQTTGDQATEPGPQRSSPAATQEGARPGGVEGLDPIEHSVNGSERDQLRHPTDHLCRVPREGTSDLTFGLGVATGSRHTEPRNQGEIGYGGRSDQPAQPRFYPEARRHRRKEWHHHRRHQRRNGVGVERLDPVDIVRYPGNQVSGLLLL